jgi:acyl-CoA synthetase (NDP forming)
MSTAVPHATLSGIFNPRSIAVLGVSARETNLGLRFTRALRRHGYAGDLWAINRRGEGVDDVPGFRDLEQVPGCVDLAIIALNADLVADAVTAAAAAGAGAALVFTSGFAEVGGAGVERQRELIALARSLGIRILGPNCVGFANIRDGVCPLASGLAFRPSILPGELAIVTQSGGVAGLLGERALDVGIGLSHVVTTGNESDITAAEVVDYLVGDGATRQIALYLEAIREPQRLADAFKHAVDAGLGVAAFKAGSGEQTAAAAAAHTGSVVGDDASFDALCRQTGVVRVHDLDHLFLVPPIVSNIGHRGSRVGVLSTSGGAAVSVADAIERGGSELPPLSKDTAQRVSAVVPGFASTQNPVDISGAFVVAMEQFGNSLQILGEAEEFDVIALVQTVHPPALAEEIADAIIAAGDPSRMLVVWIAGSQSVAARAQLRAAGFAVCESANAAAHALASVRQDSSPASLELLPVGRALARAERASTTLERLAALGAPVAAMSRAASADQAVEAARCLGYPVVIKADAIELAHKSESGGVHLGITEDHGARAAYDALEAEGLAEDGVLIQRARSGHRELLFAARADPVFGLVLAVGFGGVLTEVVGACSIILPPITAGAIEEAFGSLGLSGLLAPFRGAAAADVDALATLGNILLQVAADLGGVRHIELNPVILDGAGQPWAVDALVDVNEK